MWWRTSSLTWLSSTTLAILGDCRGAGHRCQANKRAIRTIPVLLGETTGRLTGVPAPLPDNLRYRRCQAHHAMSTNLGGRPEVIIRFWRRPVPASARGD